MDSKILSSISQILWHNQSIFIHVFVNWIITFKLRVSSIIIDIISNYYNDRLWSGGPVKGTFINPNYNTLNFFWRPLNFGALGDCLVRL